MSLKAGIVGLANVGKSTLFNILLNQHQAESRNFPFTTIDPNVGVVAVPDERLERLAQIAKDNYSIKPPIVPATIRITDIAGLISGAAQGEGLGNKFLGHIKEVDLIVEVVRVFDDKNVVRVGRNPKEDIETIRTEFALKDLETLEKYKENLKKHRFDENAGQELEEVEKIIDLLSQKERRLDNFNTGLVKKLFLLSFKPKIYLFNLSEEQLADQNLREELEKLVSPNTPRVFACLKSEAALIGMSEKEKKEYLALLGENQSAINKLIRLIYYYLGLISFFTVGPKEVRAWTIPYQTPAPKAAAQIHTDFQKNFIKVRVVKYSDFISCGGWERAKEKGRVIVGGRDYILEDGDVAEFIVGKGQ